jgi:hypothetical protein
MMSKMQLSVKIEISNLFSCQNAYRYMKNIAWLRQKWKLWNAIKFFSKLWDFIILCNDTHDLIGWEEETNENILNRFSASKSRYVYDK